MARRKKITNRANGCGTLELKPNGTWLARWMVNGQRYSKSTGTTIREEAEKILAEIVKPFQEKSEIAQIENLEAKIRTKRNEISEEELKKPALLMKDAVEAYFKEAAIFNGYKNSYGTQRIYTDMWNVLLKFVAEYKKLKISQMREFTPEMAKEFLTSLRMRVKDNTYKRYLNFMKLMWRTLKKEAKLTVDPWEEFKVPKNLQVESRRNLTMEELAKLMNSLEGEWKLLFTIGLYTGMRLVDCCHLEWGMVDMVMKRISVVPQKTKNQKPLPIQIPLHGDLYNMLDAIPEEEREGYVVPECAKYYDNLSINYKLKTFFEKAGITTSKESAIGKRKDCVVGFHSLRSGFVTIAAEAGIPFPVIQEIVGHGSTKMTEHYFKTKKETLIECVNAIPSLSNGEVKPKNALIIEQEVIDMLKAVKAEGESMEDLLKRLLNDSSNLKAVMAAKEEAEKKQAQADFINGNIQMRIAS